MLYVCFCHYTKLRQNSFRSDFLIYVVFQFYRFIPFYASVYSILYDLMTVCNKCL